MAVFSSRSISERAAEARSAQRHQGALSIGIAFKLLVGPALVMLVYVGLLRAAGNVVQIPLFESAMGPMIGASIVAIQHGLNPPLITLLVGVGITASFLSLPLWWYVLQGF
jgi:malate permease and related proteins